jgi:hypothetical protein
LIPPCKATQVENMPKKYDFVHSITHHKIYVSCSSQFSKTKFKKYNDNFIWINEDEISRINPSSLIQKALNHRHQRHLKSRDR